MNEVPLNLIPDEHRSKEVPLGMLPDEMKPKKGLVGRTLDRVFPPLPYLFGRREEPPSSFDPEGTGYDIESAKKAGLKPDETGHWQSRDPATGLLLKGRKHETWPLTMQGEKEAEHEIYKKEDGRYYSRPISFPKELAISHTPTTRTPYPTVGEGYYPFQSSMELADIRRKRSEEARERTRAKGEQIKTGEAGLWSAPSPPIGESFVPFLGTVEKRLTGEKEWGSPETLMEPGFEVAQMYLGGKVIGGVFNAIKGSTWFRMLTNKQRGLITQTVDDMLKARSDQLLKAEREVASRLGRPPQMYKYTDKNGNVGFTDDLSRIPKESTPIRDTEQIYKSEQDLLLAKSKYHRQTSELIKDYKISPTEGEIARSVESYGRKLAEGRMKGEGKPSVTPPGVPPAQPVPPEGRPSILPPGIQVTPQKPVIKPEIVSPPLPTGLAPIVKQEVPIGMVPERLVVKSKVPIEKVSQELKAEVPVEEIKEITIGLDKPRKPEKFSDITRWVIKQGGVRPDDVNIDPIGWSRKQGGPIGLISKKARYGLDELATLLPEEGFPKMSTDELSEVISNRIGRGKAPRGYTDSEIARLEDEWNQERMDILESDLQILKPDTRIALTKSLDDEIIALKEEWRERGISEPEIDSAIQEAYKIAQGQGIIETPEEIRTALTEPAKELAPPSVPSGLSPTSTYFNTPRDRFEGYAWRSMSPREYESLMAGEKTYGGTEAKKGQYLAPTPESAGQYKAKDRILVEFAGVETAEGETISNVVGKDNVTQAWDLKGDKWEKKTEDLKFPTPAPSPTRKGEQLLPGMKVGLEMPKEGIEARPTLEGTPLMEVSIKAERERVQPSLLGIMKAGKKEITVDELMALPDVKSGLRTPDDMKAYLETKGIDVKEPTKTISQFTQEYREGLGEGGFIKIGGVEKAKPKVVTPGTKDIPLISHPFEANFSSVPLMVADQHPELAGIIKSNIEAEQKTNHWILRYSDRISKAFDKVEGRGVLMEILGKERSNIRGLDLMIEGKIPIPPRLKDFVPEVKGVLKDIKGEIIEKKKNDFAESMSPKQKEYLKWVQGGSVGNEPVTAVAQYSYVNKKGKTITVPEHTRPLSQTTKDAVGGALKEFKEMEKWGLTDYFPHIFKGRYKYLTEEGGIIASGQTAKQAKANFQEYVESHPEVENETFMFVNDFYDLLTVRKTLNPELVNPLEYLGTRLSRKEFFRLLGKTENLIKEEIANAGVEDIPKVKVDMSGIASFQKGTKFSGHFMQRKTSLKGEEADPLRALLSYTFSVGRKLGLEDAKMASYAFADSLPLNMPNAKSYIKMQADNMAGRYNVIDKIFDETIGAKLGMKPFAVSRITGAGVGLESKLKLGYAPAKTMVNRMGGVLHVILKEGGINYYEGKKLLLKKDPDLISRIQSEGHLAGMEQLFAGEGLVGVSQKQTSWWRPLGTYQRAEIKNRSEALAAAYASGLKKFNGDKDAAWIYAVDSARLTQGLYNTAAKPVIVRGPILGASYQFKQYLNNEIRFMSQLTPLQWAGYIAGITAFAGTKGALLTLKSILGITLIGIGIDEVMERLNRKAPRLHRGIWGAIGVDLSAPASWQIPTSIKDWIGVFPRDLWETGEMIFKGLKNNGWTDEQINDYVRQIVPVGYNVWKGIQILAEGVTKEGTKTIYQAKDRLEGVMNLAGAKSVSQSQASDSARYMNQHRRLFLEKTGVIEDKLFNSNNIEEADKIFKELAELKNIRTLQEADDLINGLRQSAKSRMLTEEVRIFLGLPKTLKKEELERRGIPLKPRQQGGPAIPPIPQKQKYEPINSLPFSIGNTRGVLNPSRRSEGR